MRRQAIAAASFCHGQLDRIRFVAVLGSKMQRSMRPVDWAVHVRAALANLSPYLASRSRYGHRRHRRQEDQEQSELNALGAPTGDISLFQTHHIGQMMVIKLLTFLACMLASGPAMSAEVRYAIIQLDGFGHGMLVTDSPLESGASVDIQYPRVQSGAACCKRLATADFSVAPAEILLATDEIKGTQPHIYRVRVPKLWAETPFIGMAAIGQGIKTQNVKSQLESIDKLGLKRKANLCTSQEGVHLIEKEGGAMRTHLYLSLAYEVETPTCP